MIALSLVWLTLTATPLLAPPEFGDDCTTSGCHDGFQRLRFVHGPVDGDACDDCHTLTDAKAHKFDLTESGGDLCYQCHDSYDEDVMHFPASEGECTSCHDPHASNHKGLITAPMGEVCGECHEDTTEDLRFLHGPVAAGSCTTCHDPHGSKNEGLLVRTGTDLCYSCHEQLKGSFDGAKSVHAPVQDDCTGCHNAHGGASTRFLDDKLPDLCLGCHEDIAEIAEDAKFPHAPVMKGMACASCHTAHASDYPGLMAEDPIDMCLRCHEALIMAGKSKLPDMRAELEKNPHLHGPVGDRDCGGCHDVHGSEYVNLLSAAYPTQFYTPFEEDKYDLCFGCHDVELALEETTDDATGFRNGEQNLHFVHVNRHLKGRTCRACHTPHASSNPLQVRESAPFGEWEIPLGFTQTATGGSCASGCHRVYRYDRENPVQNLPPLPAPTDES